MRKIALVIGIGEYANGDNLPNAINDAKDVANALKQIGFKIDEPKLNLTHEKMDILLTKFKHSFTSGDLVLFYFAGHGTQWDDQNYLIPSDNLEITGTDIRTRAINAQDILNQINLRKPLATIFILDCCRKYHLRNPDLEKRGRATSINQPKGLRGMSNEHESLIVFACAAGAIADDSKNDRNGLFTKHFLKHIYSQNENVQMMLTDVIYGVKQESNSQQIPYIYSSLSNKRLFLNETFIRKQNMAETNSGDDIATTESQELSTTLKDSTEVTHKEDKPSPNLSVDNDNISNEMDADNGDENTPDRGAIPLLPRKSTDQAATTQSLLMHNSTAENTPNSSGAGPHNVPPSPNPSDLESHPESHPQIDSDPSTTSQVTTQNEIHIPQEIEERQKIKDQFEQTIKNDHYRDYKKILICSSDRNKSWLNLQFHDPEQRSKIIKPNEIQMTDPPESTRDETLLDRIQGSMIGMAVGDALGAPVEFQPYEHLQANPVTDLRSGETWALEKGQFTDDTSMALCLANSLIDYEDFVPYDQLVRYKWLYQHGYMSSIGRCFNIASAMRESINEFTKRQNKITETTDKNIDDYRSIHEKLTNFNVNCSYDRGALNGALVRLAPVPLFFFQSPINAVEYSGISGQITHGDRKSYDACRYYGALIVAALHGFNKDQLLDDNFYSTYRESLFQNNKLHNDIKEIAEGSYKKPEGYTAGIRGKGYIVAALEAALWAFWKHSNFEDGALAAVNLGDDTDTTAAIYGQLAGAFYGYQGLPSKWTQHVYAREFLEKLSQWIAYEGQQWYEKQQ